MLRQNFDLSRGAEAVRQTLKGPNGRMIAGAILGALLAAGISYRHENSKAGQIPLAFSEIGQMRLYVEKIGGKQIPPLTKYYASLNDSVMQVFEANNIAINTWGRDEQNFAYELEKKIEPTFRIHTQLREYAAQMPELAKNARTVLAKLAEVNQDLPPIISAMQKAWHDYHNDVYRTETETRTVCDAGGKNCRTETTTRQVYDHTDHSYVYNAKAAQEAATLLRAFVAKYPDIKVGEELLKVFETNAENEWAIRESRKHLGGYKAPTQEEYLALTNTWATGSNYAVLTPKVYAANDALKTDSPAYDAALKTSRSHYYSTYSSSDSGPREFQLAEGVRQRVEGMNDNLNRLLGGIDFAAERLPALHGKIVKFINMKLHGEKGSTWGLRREILTEAREIYKRNFAGGFDTAPSKWGMVFVWLMLGGLAGAGTGFGVDAARERLRQRQGARPS